MEDVFNYTNISLKGQKTQPLKCFIYIFSSSALETFKARKNFASFVVYMQNMTQLQPRAYTIT